MGPIPVGPIILNTTNMKILLIKDCAGHCKGDTLITEDRYAHTIIGLGFAVKVETARPVEKIEKLESKKPELKSKKLTK